MMALISVSRADRRFIRPIVSDFRHDLSLSLSFSLLSEKERKEWDGLACLRVVQPSKTDRISDFWTVELKISGADWTEPQTTGPYEP
jgi:hypothetical protein